MNFYYDRSRDVMAASTREHRHDNYEIYFLERGSCTYFVDHRYFSMSAGDVILIPSGESHRAYYKRETRSRRVISFETEGLSPNLLHALADVDHLFRAPSIVPEITEIFDLIGAEYASKNEYREALLTLHTQRLLYLIARHKRENIAKDEKNTTLDRAIGYVKENYMRELSLSQAAEACGVTAEHLSRTVKREMGIGFNEYVNLLRLQRAESMLRHENGKSVSDVAFACGFNDSNYFSTRFKKVYGVSPSHLKNESKK